MGTTSKVNSQFRPKNKRLDMNLEENTDRLCRRIGRPQWSGRLIACCLLRSSNIEIKDHILDHVMGCCTKQPKKSLRYENHFSTQE